MKQIWNQMKRKQMKASVMVEIILIIVVLIALVALFKTQIMGLVGDVFDKITKNGMAI